VTFHVEQYLEQVSSFLRTGGKVFERYMSREEFVITYGRAWTWRPSDPAPTMEPNFCFHNAGQLAMVKKELTFVEGFVLRGKLPLPIHHAWCVTPEGFVVDPTLRTDPAHDTPGREYYGVPFSTTFLRRSWAGRSTCSLLDNVEQNFPILKRDFVYVKRVHEERLSREIKSEGRKQA
jgi:hypothetical protein